MSFWQVIFLSSVLFLLFIFIGTIIYSFVIKKNIKKQKDTFIEVHENLSEGQFVEFGYGLFGTIKTVGLETCDIEIKSGAVITVSRYTISKILK